MAKKIYIFAIITIVNFIVISSQSVSEVLENSLSSVVTVAVYEKAMLKNRWVLGEKAKFRMKHTKKRLTWQVL